MGEVEILSCTDAIRIWCRQDKITEFFCQYETGICFLQPEALSLWIEYFCVSFAIHPRNVRESSQYLQGPRVRADRILNIDRTKHPGYPGTARSPTSREVGLASLSLHSRFVVCLRRPLEETDPITADTSAVVPAQVSYSGNR